MKKTGRFLNKKAFSLAEILITLSIVGVIAALTIPGLVSDTNDAELRVAWRKAFAEISQATMMVKAQYGDINFTSNTSMKDSYINVINYTRQDVMKNVFAPFYTLYKNTANQGIYFSGYSDPSVILSKGLLLGFASYGNNGGNGLCTYQSGSLAGICGYVHIDVNGRKGPNMFGKDLYKLWLVRQNGGYVAYPMGITGDNQICTKGSTAVWSSNGCSALALRTENLP